MGLTTPEFEYEAYCLDQALHHFANFVNGQLEMIKHKKPEVAARMKQGRLEQLLGIQQTTQAKFAPPPVVRSSKPD